MKAVILAAGKGDRLKDITKDIPKPMISFKGKPVLQYNIELCKKYGIEEIYINLHHLAAKIKDYFGNGEKYGVHITYSYEEEMQGTAGAIKKIACDFWKETPPRDSNISVPNSLEPFYVIYGDQISDFNLDSLKEKYQKQTKNGNKECIGVVAFHYRKDVMHSGVAEFDSCDRITRFIEKPRSGETESHWANAGVYYLNNEILDYIPLGFSDFGKQIFPILLEKKLSLYGVRENKGVCVFDTPEMYANSFKKVTQ